MWNVDEQKKNKTDLQKYFSFYKQKQMPEIPTVYFLFPFQRFYIRQQQHRLVTETRAV